MSDYLIFELDKFIFKVATDRVYTPQGVWARAEGSRVTVGVSDFVQQHHGDVVFAEVRPVGTAVTTNDPIADIETIKVDIELSSPLNGRIAAVNEALELEAELINQDPYGAGWLAVIEALDWPADETDLMDPQTYFAHMKGQAQEASG